MLTTRPKALITGASSGIGATFAYHLAAMGCDLILVARRKGRLEQQARDLEARHSVRAEILTADLTVEKELSAVENRIKAATDLDFLVNNAGFGLTGRFFAVPLDGQEQMHRLHVMAPLRLMHAALSSMVPRRRGNIINVSSVAGFAQNPGSVSYSSTKTWMTRFTEGVHMELKSIGSPVRIQALCPGFTISEFHDTMGVDRKTIPDWLWMEADDVVEASLKALERDQVIVIPGWQYRLLVLAVGAIPRRLYQALAIRYARKTGRDGGI